MGRCYHNANRTMLKKHERMLSRKRWEIIITENRIDLILNTIPFITIPYWAGSGRRELEQLKVQQKVQAGVIEPTSSEWAAPVMFPPKKDDKLCLCVVYGKFTSIKVRDTYPLTRMDQCIDSGGQLKVFTKLDGYSGYWQINICKQHRYKNAFVCQAVV